MAFLLMSVTLMHITSLGILFIATLEKSWWIWDEVEKSDLWSDCTFSNVSGSWQCAFSRRNDWLQVTQVLMVLAVIFSCLSFLLLMCQFFTSYRVRLFCFTSLSQGVAGFTDFAAVLIYTLRYKQILQQSWEVTGHFGYCFILAWICVPLLLVSSVLYLHLHKKA